MRTNLTVLTTRHIYHFDYIAGPMRAEPGAADVIYALRFQYPKPAPAPEKVPASSELSLSMTQARNDDYWYCGWQSLQPVQAWDDGVHTHLRFNPRTELPAVFVRNDDGTESLLNFTVSTMSSSFIALPISSFFDAGSLSAASSIGPSPVPVRRWIAVRFHRRSSARHERGRSS